MKKSGFLFACLFLSCLIFIIAGCGGAYVDEWEVGLYSTSPDGKWAVIVEQPSTSYEQSVVLVDLESDQFARPLEGQIQTSKNVFFSPNSDFLLYLTNESWYLYNISTNSTITQTIISIDDKAFFLNDGSIAVITENKANASLGNSEETENSNEDALLFDYFSIYFVDPNNPYERSDFSRDASENTMRTIVGGEQLCLPSTNARVAINNNGDVFAIGVNNGAEQVSKLSSSLSRRIMDFITSTNNSSPIDRGFYFFNDERGVRFILELTEAEPEVIDEYINQILQAETLGEKVELFVEVSDPGLDSEGKAAEVQSILDNFAQATSWPITEPINGFEIFEGSAVLSPNGKMLLFSRQSPFTKEEFEEYLDTLQGSLEFGLFLLSAFKYDVYLIDLVSGAEPILLTQYVQFYQPDSTEKEPTYFGFSRNGEHILFEIIDDSNERILMLARTDSPLESATELARGDYESPCWH